MRINEKYRGRIGEIAIYNTDDGLIYEVSIEGEYNVSVCANTGEVLGESLRVRLSR